MANPNTGLTPVTVGGAAGVNFGTQIIAANPTRNGLLVANISTVIAWIGPSTVVWVQGTLVQGAMPLAAGASIFFGALSAAPSAAGLLIIPYPWTAAMFAMLAAGFAGTPLTVMEF